MSDKKESWITNEHGKIIGKDTTEYHDDGSSTTTHQNAHFDWLTGAHATSITGVTENSSDGTSEHQEGSKGCFLTTACTAHAGLPDDCHELTVLREFRDGYLASLPNGEAMTREYYRVAPAIVQRIMRTPSREAILARIYTTIRKTVTLIEKEQFPSALRAYSEMFQTLRRDHLGSGNRWLAPRTRKGAGSILAVLFLGLGIASSSANPLLLRGLAGAAARSGAASAATGTAARSALGTGARSGVAGAAYRGAYRGAQRGSAYDGATGLLQAIPRAQGYAYSSSGSYEPNYSPGNYQTEPRYYSQPRYYSSSPMVQRRIVIGRQHFDCYDPCTGRVYHRIRTHYRTVWLPAY